MPWLLGRASSLRDRHDFVTRGFCRPDFDLAPLEVSTFRPGREKLPARVERLSVIRPPNSRLEDELTILVMRKHDGTVFRQQRIELADDRKAFGGVFHSGHLIA